MPRASWRGFLRLSLVSCPIYLSPATTRTKPIRLHQVWRSAPVDVDEDDLPDRDGGQQGSAPSVPRLLAEDGSPDGDQSPAATRITLRLHDPGTGAEIEKREVVKGYEYSRGQFLTFTAEELKALDVESSKIIDLEKFVPSAGIDPVYFDSPYHVHPDGGINCRAGPRLDRGGDDLALRRVRDADDVRLDDVGVLEQHLFDLERRDVDSAGLDHFLKAAAKAHAPVAVDRTEIAGEKPAALVKGWHPVRVRGNSQGSRSRRRPARRLRRPAMPRAIGSMTRIIMPGSGRP
jgi:hypothetical protein